MMPLWKKLCRALAAFSPARGGNVALTFALAALPIILSVGAAVDYSRANAVKAAMQTALDSTALMLSKDAATLSSADLQAKAQNYFDALFTRSQGNNVTITASYSTTGGSAIVIKGSVAVPTRFMGIIGYNAINLSGSSTAEWGTTRLRVALVLDNTGSMASNGKMTALQTATKNLLAQLRSAARTNGDVYVSIIPFNKDVNVGSTNYNASWIDWSDWNAQSGSCSISKYKSESSCSAHAGSWTNADHGTWNGCITDRGSSSAPGSAAGYDQNVDTPDTSITASLFPAEQYSSCPVQMTGLSYDWTSMNSLVDSMQPNGYTNQPIGLVWGWQSLVGGGPLTEPAKDSGYQYQEAIILLSDGLNTQDRWYTQQSSVDNRMYKSSDGSGTCANIKAAGITIYTIQVNTSGDPTSTLLQNCASSSDKFFLLTNANDIVTTFNTIGTNLTRLRVAK
jgi:Flp pilus assembly protein TadG